MKYEIKYKDIAYQVDDLKSFDKQTKSFQEAFNDAEKDSAMDVIVAKFDNGNVLLYTKTNRVLIELKEVDDENI